MCSTLQELLLPLLVVGVLQSVYLNALQIITVIPVHYALKRDLGMVDVDVQVDACFGRKVAEIVGVGFETDRFQSIPEFSLSFYHALVCPFISNGRIDC